MNNKIRRWSTLLLVTFMLFISPLQILAADVATVEPRDSNIITDEKMNEGLEKKEITDLTGNKLEGYESMDKPETVDEAGEDEEKASERIKNQIVDYIYVENQQVTLGEKENIIVSLLDKTLTIESATLQYEDNNGNEYFATMAEYSEGVILFNPDTTAEQEFYGLQKLIYDTGSEEVTVDLLNEGVDAEFAVVSEKPEEANEGEDVQVETSVQVIDEEGDVRKADSIEEGIMMAEEQQEMKIATRTYADDMLKNRTSTNGNIVVVLDPGHDNQHTGAVNSQNGIREEIYTLQIAKACRQELQQYNGVEVYMTVEENGDTRWSGTTVGQCLTNRVNYAKSVGADLFVSFHLNAATTSAAYGAEVYVSNYSKYNGQGRDLAAKVLAEIEKVGISGNRGIKVDTDDQAAEGNTYDDGNWVDDLSVIRNSSWSGFPSILIEHGFISNNNDASVIRNRATELGQADAQAIAEHLNLTRGPFGVLPSNNGVAGNTIVLRAYPQYIPSGYEQYRFIYYDGETWKELSGYSNDEIYEWKPAAGKYSLCLEAKNEKGEVQQYFWGPYVVVEPTISIKGINISESRNGMVVQWKPNVDTNSSSLKYRYQIYDVGRNLWMTLKDKTDETSVEWMPSKSGTYWLHTVAIAPNGKEYSYTAGYVVDSERAYINSFVSDKASMEVGEKVTLKADYNVLEDGNIKHQFLAYDGQYWQDITKDSKNSLVWSPAKEGNYLMCYQISTGSGKVYQSFLSITVTGKYITINGIDVGQMDKNGQIRLSANIYTNDTGVLYTYKAYDMKTWKTISSGTDKSTLWKPKKSGDYLLYIEVKGSNGQTSTYAMGCRVPELVKINSFRADKVSPQGIGSKITLSGKASIVSSVSATYEYMYYDGKYWQSIQKEDSLKDAEWVPQKGGSYLVCFQIVTEAGEVYQSFLGYDITEPIVEIQGIDTAGPNSKGEISLDAKIKSTDSSLKYTYQIYDMEKWYTISKDSKNKTTIWTPQKTGAHLIHLEVQGSTGKKYTYDMGYAVQDVLRITGLKMNVSSPQAYGTSIKLSGQISAIYTKGLTYQYLAYNGHGWQMIDSSKELKEISWTPKEAGNYSLCFQVIDGTGNVVQWFTSYVIEEPNVNINSISVGKINANKQVNLRANVSTNGIKLKYTFQAYDMNKWITIVSNSDSPSVVWDIDKEGTYLLHLEVSEPSGVKHTYDMGCTLENNVETIKFTSDLASPQKLRDGLSIKLSGIATATYTEGLKARYMAYDGNVWSLIGERQSLSSSVDWVPAKKGDYLLCFQIETESGRQINQFLGYAITDSYYIMGQGSATVQQMTAFFKAKNPNYDKYTKPGLSGYNGILARKGAPDIETFCEIFKQEAEAEGVKVEVAFCQAMLETGYLTYGNDVKPDQCNFAGLGATGNGVSGNRFNNVREGIRAQIQHLKCYASKEDLNNACVDPRWAEYLRGTAPTVEQLGQKWAASVTYGDNIIRLIGELSTY